MELSTATQRQDHAHRPRIARPGDDIRYRALARLYERRSAVDHLIHALERYQQDQKGLRAEQAASIVVERLS
jgi:hypothetical protein